MSWLDDLAAAKARGARGMDYVNPLECGCDICLYRTENHTLAEIR